MSGKGYRYTGLDFHRGVVTIGSTVNGDEHEAFVPLGLVLGLEVDWTIESGQITVRTAGLDYAVTFDDDDHGQGCADALSAYFTAIDPPAPVAEPEPVERF